MTVLAAEMAREQYKYKYKAIVQFIGNQNYGNLSQDGLSSLKNIDDETTSYMMTLHINLIEIDDNFP